jgi:hypothetical protein
MDVGHDIFGALSHFPINAPDIFPDDPKGKKLQSNEYKENGKEGKNALGRPGGTVSKAGNGKENAETDSQ